MTNEAQPQPPTLWSFLTRGMDWLQLLLFNSGIALLLTLITSQPFLVNLLYSQCIGISIASSLTLLTRVRGLPEPRGWVYLVAVPVGAALGIAVALLLTGHYVRYDKFANFDDALRGFGFSVLIGAAASWYFLVRDRRLKARIALAEQQLRTAETERQLNETRLQLLQAQIEPHFLFNTLSNVIGLIEPRPEDARAMLESLTVYLRATLRRTREQSGQVADEIELLKAYLAIQRIRMGERLSYRFDVADDVGDLPLAPLLLQPLVENAIRHGLEPKVGNGELSVYVARQDDRLVCEVQDDGIGLSAGPGGDGVGLANVRRRLQSLYGPKTALDLQETTPGVTVRLQIPLDRLESVHEH